MLRPLLRQLHTHTRLHGRLRVDQYAHLRSSQRALQAVLKRQNQNFARWVEVVAPHYKKWHSKVMARRVVSSDAAAEKYGSSLYFTRVAENPQNSLLYFRRPELGGPDELIFDLQELPQKIDLDQAFVQALRISHDESAVAFLYDPSGQERCQAGIKDLRTGLVQDIRLQDCASIEFSQDSETLYYVEMDELRRPYRLKKRRVQSETAQAQDQLIYEEADPECYLSVQLSKDKEYLILTSQARDFSKLSFIAQNGGAEGRGEDEVRPFWEKEAGFMGTLDHVREHFVLVASGESGGMRVLLAKESDIGKRGVRKDKLAEVLRAGPSEVIYELDRFKDYLVAYVRDCGRSKLLVYNFQDQEVSEVRAVGEMSKLREDGGLGVVEPGVNMSYDEHELYYYFSSPLEHQNLYSLHMRSKACKLVSKTKLRGPRIARDNYHLEQVLAPGHDGEAIPITLLHQRGLSKNQKNKLLIHVYGAYGIPVDLNFHVDHLAAVDQGWVIAYPHVRGGNDLGSDWHRAGTLLNKPNSIHDFLTAAMYLLAEGYSHPNYLAAEGSSAGAILVAAGANLRPELFRACVLNVPFLDMLSVLSDDSIPLTTTDYPQFGDPRACAKLYDVINSYSPYENISEQEYPAMLINLALEDPRIPEWSVMKYVEKLRDLAAKPERMPELVGGSKNVVVRAQGTGGHLGSANNTANLEDSAWSLAWVDSVMFKAKRSWLF